jgi:hypothetical protein
VTQGGVDETSFELAAENAKNSKKKPRQGGAFGVVCGGKGKGFSSSCSEFLEEDRLGSSCITPIGLRSFR